MKTSVVQLGTNKYKLEVQVPSGELAQLLDRTYRRLAREIRIPGFRPGKVPKPIIDQRLGREHVRNEALRDGLSELYQQAVAEAGLDVVAPPSIEVEGFDDDLRFDATVETRPVPELKDYSGLEVSRPSDEVTESEVDESVERLRTRFGTLEDAEGELAEGDYASADITTTHGDHTVEELSQQDLLLRVGDEMIVPEVDAALVGKRAGDTVTVDAVLPEHVGGHGGEQVSITVTVKQVKTLKLAPLDDDLAKTASEFDTLDELRADLRRRLQEYKTAQSDKALRTRVLDAFIDHGVEVELPDGMVDMEVDRLARTTLRMLQARKISLEQYLEASNSDVDAWRSQMRPQAERNLTLMLGLRAVAEAEGLSVADQDREAEIERMASDLGRMSDQVREMLSDAAHGAALDGDILQSKALDLLVERANVTTEPAEESTQDS